MINPYERFKRIEDDPQSADSRFVYTPEAVRKQFFGLEDGPVQTVLQRLKRAGVPEDVRTRYLLAVEAFFRNPSSVAISSAFSFQPQTEHFGPEVYFKTDKPALPHLVNVTRLKPHLAETPNGLSEVSIDGGEVLNGYIVERRVVNKPTAEELLLIQLNRLTYAMHEPIHIMQGFSKGDLLNIVLRETGVQELADPKKQNALMEADDFYGEQRIPHSSRWEKSVIGLPKEWDTIEHDSFFVAAYEASMDILSQEAVAEYLKQQPALLLWVHNTLCSLVQGLREIKRKLDTKDATISRFHLMEALMRMQEAMTFIAPVYFSVFENSAQGCTRLKESAAAKKVLGRYLTGAITVTDAFTWCDIENLQTECHMKTHRTSSRTEDWYFPVSGKVELMGILEGDAGKIEAFPITDAGLTLASSLVVAASKKGWTQSEVEEELRRLQQILIRYEEAEPELESQLEEIRIDWEARLERTFTNAELKELFGIQHYLYPELYVEYPKKFLVRKAMVNALEAAGEPVEHLFRDLFFEAQPIQRGFELLVGVAHQKERSSVDRSLQEMLQDTALGIFSVDVPALSDEQRSEIIEWFLGRDAFTANGASPSADYFRPFLKKQAEWKKAQLAKAKVSQAA